MESEYVVGSFQLQIPHPLLTSALDLDDVGTMMIFFGSYLKKVHAHRGRPQHSQGGQETAAVVVVAAAVVVFVVVVIVVVVFVVVVLVVVLVLQEQTKLIQCHFHHQQINQEYLPHGSLGSAHRLPHGL